MLLAHFSLYFEREKPLKREFYKFKYDYSKNEFYERTHFITNFQSVFKVIMTAMKSVADSLKLSDQQY